MIAPKANKREAANITATPGCTSSAGRDACGLLPQRHADNESIDTTAQSLQTNIDNCQKQYAAEQKCARGACGETRFAVDGETGEL